jgi:hypothetical protein
LDHPEPEDGCQKIAKLEGDEYQHEEHMEEVGDVPAEELKEAKLSEEVVEQKLSKELVELESTVGWKFKATEEKTSMGDQDDLPFDVYKEKEFDADLSALGPRSAHRIVLYLPQAKSAL